MMDRDLIRCAQANFENLEKNFQMVKFHPFYLIAKAQLDEALGTRTVAESIARAQVEGYLAVRFSSKDEE